MINENIIDYLQANFKKNEIDKIIEDFYKLLIDINKYNNDELGILIIINYINDLFSKIENVKTVENNFTNIYTQLSIENSTDLIMNRLSERFSSNIHYLLLFREFVVQGSNNLDPEIFNCGIEFEDIQALVYINKTKEDNLKKIYTNKNFKKKISEFLQSISAGIISSNTSESNDSE
jgi:virulence-associated protein VapD